MILNLLQKFQHTPFVTILSEQHHLTYVLRVMSNDSNDVRMTSYRLHHLNFAEERFHLLDTGRFSQCFNRDYLAVSLKNGTTHQSEGSLTNNAVQIN